MKKISFFLLSLFLTANAFSQETKVIEMADVFRSSGKIYVVVAVLLVIFAGIIVYLISIDRKLSRLEKEQQQNTTLKNG